MSNEICKQAGKQSCYWSSFQKLEYSTYWFNSEMRTEISTQISQWERKKRSKSVSTTALKDN